VGYVTQLLPSSNQITVLVRQGCVLLSSFSILGIYKGLQVAKAGAIDRIALCRFQSIYSAKMSSTTGELTVPPSPRYQTVLSTFTTLNDDIWPNLCSGISHPHEISSASEAFQESPLRGPSVCNSPGDLRLSPNLQPRLQNHQFHSREKAKKKQVSRVQEHFFCLATGKVVKKERKRSAFTKERRREVTQVRDLGACLRCRIRKKPVG
jgi:hypothetical protein